jgi:hypothetical protein
MYRTIILPLVLYRCGTWSLILREKRRLRVFENRVLRRIFGPKRDEVIGEWRKIHIEELNNLYSSPNIVRVIKIEKNEMGEACNAYGGEEMRMQGFGGETSGKRDHLGDPGVHGRIILRWTFRKWDVGWLRIGTGGGHL